MMELSFLTQWCCHPPADSIHFFAIDIGYIVKDLEINQVLLKKNLTRAEHIIIIRNIDINTALTYRSVANFCW